MKASSYRALVETSSALPDVESVNVTGDDRLENLTRLLERIQPILDSIGHVELRGCVVPLKYEPDFLTSHTEDVKRLQNLGRALRLAANVAAHDGRYEAAARYGTTILELAKAVCRGGLVLDYLLAVGMTTSGVDCLRTVRDRFSENVRRDLIASLERYESERESFLEIAERDARWERESGYQEDRSDISEERYLDPKSAVPIEIQRAMFQMVEALPKPPEAATRSLIVEREQVPLTVTRLLAIDLAIRCWQDRNGGYPKSLGELVPEVLASVSQDPFTGGEFVYRAEGNSFALYSTGPDKTDSGGNFAPWFACSVPGYDLGLDTHDGGPECGTNQAGRGRLLRLWLRMWNWPHSDNSRRG